ncbi:hypothetical protein FQA39_LY11965 [Lamprigera yunnana]|nr:hypothetical protein FQA39_LY11965 [Lamprigera yunnana]
MVTNTFSVFCFGEYVKTDEEKELRNNDELLSQEEHVSNEGKKERFSQETINNGDISATLSTPPKKSKPVKIKMKEVANCTNELNTLAASLNSPDPPEDEFQIFGRSVAVQLTKLPLDRAITA